MGIIKERYVYHIEMITELLIAIVILYDII